MGVLERPLERVLLLVDVHPRPLVQLEGAGRALAVNAETDPVEAARAELFDGACEKREGETAAAPGRADSEHVHPAEARLERLVPRAQADPGDLIAVQGQELK